VPAAEQAVAAERERSARARRVCATSLCDPVSRSGRRRRYRNPGVAAAVIPDIVIATGRYLVSPAALYAAAALRAGVRLVLILAARVTGTRPTPCDRSFGVRVEGVAFVCFGGLIVSALRRGGRANKRTRAGYTQPPCFRMRRTRGVSTAALEAYAERRTESDGALQ
jgi:hypothetical protein